MNFPFAIYLFILIELALVSWIDIRYKKISNRWPLLNLSLVAVLFLIFPNIYYFDFKIFLYPLAFLGVGFLLFSLNIMGGGDSKFLASLFFIIPYELQDIFFYYLLLSTLIIGVLFFIRNIIEQRKQIMVYMKNADIGGIKTCFGTKFAFAPVILTAWAMTGRELYL